MGLIILGIAAIIYGLLRMLGKVQVNDRINSSIHKKEYLKMSGLSTILLGVVWIVVAVVCNLFKLGSLVTVIIAVGASIPCLLIESKAGNKYID